MMYRQGDVLLRRVSAAPIGMKSVTGAPKVVLAYGETTGHHHRFEDGRVTAFFKEGDEEVGAQPINGGVFVGQPSNVQAVVVPEGGSDLVHEEHDPIHVEPGTYEIVRQREYVAPNIQRAVID